MQLEGNEVDRWSIAQDASFPINHSIDQPNPNQIHHQIDGRSLAASKFGQGQSAIKNYPEALSQ